MIVSFFQMALEVALETFQGFFYVILLLCVLFQILKKFNITMQSFREGGWYVLNNSAPEFKITSNKTLPQK